MILTERKNIMKRIRYFLFEIKQKLCNNVKRYFINVASLEETISKVKSDNYSISRFGDGEFYIMEGQSIGFQEANLELAHRLKEVINSHDKKHLVCLSEGLNPKNYYKFTPRHVKWMKKNLKNTYEIRLKYIQVGEKYYNALVSRFWIPYKNKGHAMDIASMLKSVWKGRSVVIIEGVKTRMGVGNDLLSEAASINRIIGPCENAFSKYNDIFEAAQTFSKDSLFLIALGPTATVLAYNLCRLGYQALDIGHVDMEYEWMKMGTNEQVNLNNKYVNELPNGNVVDECNDKNYIESIKFDIQ